MSSNEVEREDSTNMQGATFPADRTDPAQQLKLVPAGRSKPPEMTTMDTGGQATTAASWQRQLAEAIRDRHELLAKLRLPDEPLDAAEVAATQGFPTLVPLSFLARMEPENRDDPLLLQVLPVAAEAERTFGFTSDPVGDSSARAAPGMLHKYHGRALLITSGTCAVHCRYCFRREYPYSEEPRRLSDWDPALQQISADRSITEVILSGGDPLILNDDRLRTLCRRIDDIDHVERLRIHTRLPIVLPARVTDELLNVLKDLRIQTVVVVHANHGNEIAADCETALQTIVRKGIPVLNQAVLLRNVNDSADALELLCRRLVNIGVMPYYLHQLDRVHGAAHFEVTDTMARELINEIRTRLPGYAVPQLVRELPGGPGKMPLL
ncbi:MAG: EF-P beta-lysylation protein EpmB [Fuerstiella sp.]|jgi:L-lysine 2,3-aminomutase|nr:EF-P beta-lysylation protein EpmB [Fuerstiella sp.]